MFSFNFFNITTLDFTLQDFPGIEITLSDLSNIYSDSVTSSDFVFSDLTDVQLQHAENCVGGSGVGMCAGRVRQHQQGRGGEELLPRQGGCQEHSVLLATQRKLTCE